MRLRAGETAARTVRITEEHIELFARLTGDRNPIHHDEAFARAEAILARHGHGSRG